MRAAAAACFLIIEGTSLLVRRWSGASEDAPRDESVCVFYFSREWVHAPVNDHTRSSRRGGARPSCSYLKFMNDARL